MLHHEVLFELKRKIVWVITVLSADYSTCQNAWPKNHLNKCLLGTCASDSIGTWSSTIPDWKMPVKFILASTCHYLEKRNWIKMIHSIDYLECNIKIDAYNRCLICRGMLWVPAKFPLIIVLQQCPLRVLNAIVVLRSGNTFTWWNSNMQCIRGTSC